jgi:hypothetical protein
MKNLNHMISLLFTAIAIVSCTEKVHPVITPPPVNEDEVITTVTTTLTNSIHTVTLKSRDLDGNGPATPVVTISANIIPGATYTGTVSFLNEIANPIQNITQEVEQEGVDHQLFFQAPTTLGAITYDDADANGKPIGLKFKFTAGNVPTTGNLIVTLRHKPNKNATGVATGIITNAAGETDAEVVYPISIQ